MMQTTNVKTALSEWQKWRLGLKSLPRVIRKFESGLTNASYLIEANGRKLKLRINSPISEKLGINREHERSILESISSLDISPKLLYSSEAFCYSVFEFIEGHTWTIEDTNKASNRNKIETLISQFQHIRTNLPKRDYLAYFNNYDTQLSQLDFRPNEWKAYLIFKEEIALWLNSKPKLFLCHHDLTPENIIEKDGSVFILDWEYAAPGCGDLDYLSIGSKGKITDPFSKELNFWLNTLWAKINDRAFK